MEMDVKNLAAGIREMRSVAKRLMTWADDLEKAGEEEKEVLPPEPAAAETAPAEKDKPVTRAEVKAFLTTLCAKGYSAQVKALIGSFGAASLSGVPDGELDELFNAALLLGAEEDSGGEPDAR